MQSIQERLFPDMTCFGCGPANAQGLRLRSFPADVGTRAEFTPRPEHDNGLGFLNGGIIATILDCHSASAVFDDLERRGMPVEQGASLPYVTAGLDLRYLRPAPLHETSVLHATVASREEGQMLVEVELLWDDKPRARATALWKLWRPRS